MEIATLNARQNSNSKAGEESSPPEQYNGSMGIDVPEQTRTIRRQPSCLIDVGPLCGRRGRSGTLAPPLNYPSHHDMMAVAAESSSRNSPPRCHSALKLFFIERDIMPPIPRSKSTQYWLMKTEPDLFSIDDLARATNQTTSWIGVRNYQARNYMRDQMRLGDKVLIYHSNAKPSCVVGTATVTRTAHADYTAWDSSSPYYDPKSSPENPRWQMVDVKLDTQFSRPLVLEELRKHETLAKMVLLKKGMRLSIQPVTVDEFKFIVKLSKS